MIIVERMIQQVFPDKWVELEAIDKRYDAVEGRFGYPAKKRYQSLMGSIPMGTLIIERQWASLAAMEAANEKFMANPEGQALQKEITSIVKSVHWELYMPLP